MEYQICTNCIMDTTDPDIYFDGNGICNHCHYYENYKNNVMFTGNEAKLATQQMVAEIKNRRPKGSDYDCIMGLSGGVDSSYLAWYAVKVLGLKPLVVHVDSGWNSELAVNNIENIVNILGLDLHTLVLDWDEIRDLQRSFFKASVPNCDIPQDFAFFAGLYKEAKKYKIKSILNGGNMQTESILPRAWGYSSSDLIHLRDVHKKFGSIKLKEYPVVNYLQKTLYYQYILKLKVFRPLEYIPYNKAEAKHLLIHELKWRDYGGKHFESVFTKFFQAYYLPVKFGFDKRKAHLSSLIVSGQMTREEAVIEMMKPLYDAQQLKEDTDYFIKKLGFSQAEWTKIMEQPPVLHENFASEVKLHSLMRKLIYRPILIAKKALSK